jgi:hypothetical protein
MKRKHAFVVVVLLAGAFIAGLFALTRTNDLSASTTTSPAVSEAAIRARMKALDRFEASLRRELRAGAPKLHGLRAGEPRSSSSAPAVGAAPSVTYVRAPAAVSSGPSYEADDDGEHEDEADEEIEHEDD